MPDIKFDLSEIDIDALVEFEEGDQNSVKFIRGFLGRFVSNGKDEILSPEKGAGVVGKVKLTEMNQLQAEFMDEVNKVTAAVVNPTTEDDSDKQ